MPENDKKKEGLTAGEVGRFAKFVAKRQFNRAKRGLQDWNEGTGQKWSERTQQKAQKATHRATEKANAIKAEATEGISRAAASEEWDDTKRQVRLGASIVASTALFALIALIFYAITRGGSDPADPGGLTDLACENCSAAGVELIIDGDTLDTTAGRIRVYGADTPELGDRCFEEATDEMKTLAGETVRLESGPRAEDPFGRQLYYVYTESGDSIDELLISRGLAIAWIQDGQHREHLKSLEAEARQANTGCLWGT